jgi:hypothetical protein
MSSRQLIRKAWCKARRVWRGTPQRAFRKVVPIKAFVDEYTFVTGDGAGVCLRVPGIDDECRSDEERLGDSRDLIRAQRQFDEMDRLYQYAIRSTDCPIVYRQHGNSRLKEFTTERAEFLDEKAEFGRIELYAVPYRSAKYRGHGEEMAQERQRVCSTIRAKAEQYAGQTQDPFGTHVLSKDDAFRFFRKLLNLNGGLADSVDLHHDLSVDYQLVGSVLAWDESLRHLRMGARHVRVLSIKEADLKHDSGLPSHTLPNLFKQMLSVNCDMIVCQQWHRVEKPEVRGEVRGQKKHILDFEHHGAFAPESEDKEVADLMADDSAQTAVKRLGGVLEGLSNEGEQYGLFSYTVILHGEDNGKLDAAIAKINQIWGEYEGALFEEDRGALAAFLSILPGNQKYAVREHWIADTHWADLSLCYAPDIGRLTVPDLPGDPEYLAVFETEDGTPFYLDPFVGGAFGIFGVGKRGRGKTFLANFLFASSQKYGGYSVILDLGQNYRQVVNHFGGSIISLDLKTQSFGINPFFATLDAAHHECLFNFLRFLIEADGTELKHEHERELFEQIESHYCYDLEDRTLTNFYKNAPPAYRAQLSKWIRGGQYGWVFDNVQDSIALSRITCFEFAGVDDYQELVEPLVLWILGRVRVAFFDPAIVHEFKFINADEVWKFLKNQKILDWLTGMLKFGRNRLVACALWTQSAEDLGPAMRLVIDNCETVTFLGNPNFDRELYRNCFGFNSRQLEIAAELPRRSILWKTQEWSKVLKLRVQEQMRWMFTTKPKEQRERQLAMAEHGTKALEVLASRGEK